MVFSITPPDVMLVQAHTYLRHQMLLISPPATQQEAGSSRICCTVSTLAPAMLCVQHCDVLVEQTTMAVSEVVSTFLQRTWYSKLQE